MLLRCYFVYVVITVNCKTQSLLVLTYLLSIAINIVTNIYGIKFEKQLTLLSVNCCLPLSRLKMTLLKAK